MGRQSIRRLPNGFTLVEVIVSLTLLSLILLGLVGSLRSFGAVSAKLEAQTLANDDARLVSAFLQRAIGRASSRKVTNPASKASQVWFFGSENELICLGHLPVRYGAGGLTYLRLFVARDPAGGGAERLLLQFRAFANEPLPPDLSQTEPEALVDDLDSMQIEYRGFGEDAWLPAWVDTMVLPEYVRISLSGRGKAWPPIVIRVDGAETRAGPDAKIPEASSSFSSAPPLRWR